MENTAVAMTGGRFGEEEEEEEFNVNGLKGSLKLLLDL